MVRFFGYSWILAPIYLGLSIDEGREKLSWLGKMDTGTLKNKVAASIVAISSIYLLKVFVNAENINNDKLMLYISHLPHSPSSWGCWIR